MLFMYYTYIEIKRFQFKTDMYILIKIKHV